MSALREEDHDGGEGDLEPVGWTFTDAPIMRWFEYSHLRGSAATISARFAELAGFVATHTRPGPERSVALRKLLEAKDAAVRAVIHPGG